MKEVRPTSPSVDRPQSPRTNVPAEAIRDYRVIRKNQQRCLLTDGTWPATPPEFGQPVNSLNPIAVVRLRQSRHTSLGQGGFLAEKAGVSTISLPVSLVQDVVQGSFPR